VFSVMPEMTFTVGHQLTPRWRDSLGYSVIYWTQVARAGQQIDAHVDLGTTESTRPQGWQDADFWTQGLNFGLDYRY